MGPFTVNMWERANASDQDGDLFQYMYSHSGYASRRNFAPVDAFHPNQVKSQAQEHCLNSQTAGKLVCGARSRAQKGCRFRALP